MAVTSAIESQLSLSLTQQINAEPRRVFEAWLDPNILCKWIGPRAWVESCETVVLEPQIGGRYQLRTQARAVAGHEPCSGGVSGVYRRIDRYSRLSFTWLREGEVSESLVTITFAPSGKGTLVTLTHQGFTSEEARDQHQAGWAGSLPQLADLLDLRLTLKQYVNAPPQRVFDALVDPTLISRWMGPRSMVQSCEVMTMEPRVGGKYRIKMNRRPDAPGGRPGTLFVTGTYQTVDRPNRLTYSWMWEDQGHESRVTYELKPHAGGTEVTLIHEGFANVETREGHSRGWTASLQQLAQLLESA